MRQIFVEIPTDSWDQFTTIVDSYEVINMWRIEMPQQEDSGELIMMHTSNGCVEDVLSDLRQMGEVKITLNPDDVFIFNPPYHKATGTTINLDRRMSVEVYMDGLRSIGSWRSYLLYALASAVVAWIGLAMGAIIPLVAAILIGPFGSPAMNVALSTARGDTDLLTNSLARYAGGIAVAIAMTLSLSLLVQPPTITPLMTQAASISPISFLLPVVTGAIGAHNLFRTEGSSLVPGTAVGALVAASIIPAASVIGMAIGSQHWEMVDNGVFLLLLQLVGINFGGALVFRLYGIKAKESRYELGEAWLFPAAVTASAVMLAGLLVWQAVQPRVAQTSSRQDRIAERIRQEVVQTDSVELLRVDVAASPEAEDTYLATVVVKADENALNQTALEDQITQALRRIDAGEISLLLSMVDS